MEYTLKKALLLPFLNISPKEARDKGVMKIRTNSKKESKYTFTVKSVKPLESNLAISEQIVGGNVVTILICPDNFKDTYKKIKIQQFSLISKNIKYKISGANSSLLNTNPFILKNLNDLLFKEEEYRKTVIRDGLKGFDRSTEEIEEMVNEFYEVNPDFKLRF